MQNELETMTRISIESAARELKIPAVEVAKMMLKECSTTALAKTLQNYINKH